MIKFVSELLRPGQYSRLFLHFEVEARASLPPPSYAPAYTLISCPPKNKDNKANLRDLIAATCLVILLKFDTNRRFDSPCDLEMWWMTSRNNRAPLLYDIKLCASFQIHQWIQTGVTVRKCPICVKINDFLAAWPWNLTDDLEKQ